MRKFTLFLMSLFLSLGAMAQVISGISNVPTEKTAPQSLKTGYYLLKQANEGAISSGNLGYIKADNENVNSAVSIATKAPTAGANNEATYVWFVEKADDGSITIATANKKAYWQAPWQGQKNLAAEPSALGIVTESVTLGGKTATPTEGTAIISNNNPDNLSLVHYSGGKLGSWNDANPASVWFVEFYEVSVEDLNFEYAHNNGQSYKTSHRLTSFTLTDGENSLAVTDIQPSTTANAVYVDKSALQLTTTAGSTLEFSEFNWVGWAMHAFAFVDYNKDYTFNSTANNNGEGDGEVVSYNYYKGYDITGAPNSEGNTQNSQIYGNSKGMPAFTLPADLEPGEYRMRVKIDWDNLDGNYGASDIATNGGCQCDITLVVKKRAANSEAKAELKAAIEELDAYLASIPLGNCITQYSTSIDSPEAQIQGVKDFYNQINDETTIESIEECTAAVREIKESYKENVLEDGKFYHIRSVVYENGYVYASLSDDDLTDDYKKRNGICWETTTKPSNAATWKCEIVDGVTYFKNVHTASYMSRLATYLPGVLSETEKAPITITALGDGQVNFLVDDSLAHAQHSENKFFFVPWKGGKNTASAWYIEEATAGVQNHTLTVGAAGYATLMLGYNTVIPAIDGEDCGVFVATVEGKYAVLKEIGGVLPANTAVIVKAAPGNYTFKYTAETAVVESNSLNGTLYDKTITEPAYVLGIIDGVVGLYRATTTGEAEGTFLNNANKAYLPASVANGAASYSFRFEGTTGIEQITENREQSTVIYDLTGRRVEAVTAPGIYIVNGKKVLVK